MLNVYLVRHGQTDTNKMNAVNGSSMNLPLNETGVEQAQRLHASFDINEIDHVYASPLKRAKQTAEILTSGKRQIIFDDRLKEMNYGSWDGLDSKPLHRDYPQAFDELGYLKENYSDFCSGETFAHLHERLMDFWHDLINKHENESVLIVFHGTASRSLVQGVLGVPDIVCLGEMQNAGVIKLSVEDQTKKTFLRYYNRIAPGEFFI